MAFDTLKALRVPSVWPNQDANRNEFQPNNGLNKDYQFAGAHWQPVSPNIGDLNPKTRRTNEKA